MVSLKDVAKKLSKEYKMHDLIIKSDIKPNYERLAC